MNVADWVVLLGTIVGIAAYGAWRTRHVRSLNTYLRGNTSTGWGTIGLTVMATQASAITFLSHSRVRATRAAWASCRTTSGCRWR